MIEAAHSKCGAGAGRAFSGNLARMPAELLETSLVANMDAARFPPGIVVELA
jgi:hypothetical protein